jgi:hypothetical protein
MSKPTFTATEIATALGIDRRTVRWHLRAVRGFVKLVNGNKAAAWTRDQFPPVLEEKLSAAAVQQRCRSVEALLTMPHNRWQPALPLEKICEADIQAATKLRDALQPSLARQHEIKPGELEAIGLADYKRVFGNEISARYWRELFARAIRRDAAFEEWNRLEIYLPEKPKAKVAPAQIISEALAENFNELGNFIAACGNPHDPSTTEREAIWTLALEKFRSLVMAGEPDKSAARSVRQFLFARASFLAASRDALLKAFNRKLESFTAANGDAKALRDGRENNGPIFQLPDDDRDALIQRAAFYYRGQIASAWRDLLQSRKFSAATLARYSLAANKSHVPTTVRDSVAPEVEILTVMHQGRRAFDSIKGHVTRSYDGIASLQCISGDDFTLNTYFYVPDGNGWFNLTRGQVILFIDFRSLRILGWALEPRKSYSSLTIRSLCTHIFGAYGVPQVLYFERGLWKSSTLLKGKTDPFTFTEISQGLREFGIVFKHAIRPRTKAVERIGGMFQDIAEAEPGYCGRDERRDAPESLRRQMAEVDTRKTHPSKFFYSLDQWNERIGQLVEQYNTAGQQGHMLDGLSPDDAFEKFLDANNPPLQFPAGLRYLLAHDKRLARVTLNGITIQVGKQKFNYRGAEIAHLVGRDVLAWFDPENPESIVVTNPDRTNPICVARSENPNALESIIAPDAGTLGRELSRIEGQASYMKTRFNVVKSKFPMPARILLNAAQMTETGVEIAAQKSAVDESQKRQRRQRTRAQQFARETGIVVPVRAVENLEADENRFLADFLKGEELPAAPSLTTEGGKIIYHLKPFDDEKKKS